MTAVRIQATESEGRYYPLIEVQLVIKRQGTPVRLNLTALVDSGADRTIVPPDIVDALQLDLDRLEIVKDGDEPMIGMGAGGEFQMRWLHAKVRYRNWTFAKRIWVAESKLPAVLVGRDDFFKHFDISFLWADKPPSFTLTKR